MEISNETRVQATLLATAGVVAESGDVRIMVDGLFTGEGHPFSVVPRAISDGLMTGKAPFGPVDHLMFTHLHPDHFDADQTIAFLERNPVKSVLLPADASSERRRLAGEKLRQWMDANGVYYHMPELPAGRSAEIGLEGVMVTAFNTMHMGPKYRHVSNYCLLLRLGGRGLLFTGDADFDEAAFTGALAGRKADAAFVNPLFFQDPRGRALLDTAVRPETVVLYHLPFEEDDTLMMRPMVKWQIEKHKGAAYRVLALSEPGQRISL